MTQEISLTPVNTLHRYYLNANRMRTHFDKTLENKSNKSKHIFEIESRMYMELWYGLLYVVIEGWEELKLHDSKIDPLLSSNNKHLLKGVRHSVFHYQKEYNEKRFNKFCKESTTVEWVRTLNQELGRWFLDYLRKNKE